jgi:biopolymer transport protein ExbD
MHHPGRGKRARKATRELPEEEPEFQIAPMVDILLVLLVFFMSIASTQVLQSNDKVRLPVAKEGKDLEETGGLMIVNVLWNSLAGGGGVGTLDVDGQKYDTAQQLVERIRDHIAKNPEASVLVRADKEVKYDYIRSLLKAAGQASVTNITFSVVNQE